MTIFQKIGVGVCLVILPIVIGAYTLGMFKVFAPATENIRRGVFEETKSYVHGKTQDLAKYYGEYKEAQNQSDKNTIKNIVKIRFAEFDESYLKSPELIRFLKNTRGY